MHLSCVYLMTKSPVSVSLSLSSGPTWSWNLCTVEEICVPEVPVPPPNGPVSVSRSSRTTSFLIFHNVWSPIGFMSLLISSVLSLMWGMFACLSVFCCGLMLRCLRYEGMQLHWRVITGGCINSHEPLCNNVSDWQSKPLHCVRAEPLEDK